MRIESGLGKRTVTRLGLVFLLFAAFAAWFAYDGWVKYPQMNLDEARQAFPENAETPTPNPAVTEKDVKDLKADPGRELTMADLTEAWGEPAYLGSAGAQADAGERVAFFVGPYGWARATLDGERVEKVDWRAASKASSDIAVQQMLAGVLLAAAAIPLLLLLLQLPKKYILDDEGLVLPSSGRITYEQMTGIDASALHTKGLVRLQYRDAAGQDRVAVLDEEKIDRFDEIVVGLCEKKGWPVQVESALEEADAPDAEKQ